MENWSEQVILMLLELYLELLRESDGLRELSFARDCLGCRGCAIGRKLEVICIYFESLLCLFFSWSLKVADICNKQS